jgi:DedD protein
MGLFSFLRKNKQEESASGQGGFSARAGDDAGASRARAKRKTARESDDTEIPEKKRARRRLIGAIVLVLIVVVALPMVFDPEPNPEIDQIAIQIPSREQPVTTTSVAPVAPVLAEAGEDGPAPEDLEEVVTAPVTPVAPATPAAALPVTPSVAPPVQTPAAPVKPVEPPKVTAQPKVDESARALAILEGRNVPAATQKPAATGGKFVIQVAALASQEKVTELRKKLSDAGIKSFTQKVATQAGERTRIRVGPFTGKDEAEKMRARINKLGLSATLVPA